MQVIRAKDINNKLEADWYDCFAIDSIELLEEGFVLYLSNVWTGETRVVTYGSREMFDAEWELYGDLRTVGFKRFQKEDYNPYWD